MADDDPLTGLRHVAREAERAVAAPPFSVVLHRARLRRGSQAALSVAAVAVAVAAVPVLAGRDHSAPRLPAKVDAPTPRPADSASPSPERLPDEVVLPPAQPVRACAQDEGVRVGVSADGDVWALYALCPTDAPCLPRAHRWNGDSWLAAPDLQAMSFAQLVTAPGGRAAVVGSDGDALVGSVTTDGGRSWASLRPSAKTRDTGLAADDSATTDITGPYAAVVDWTERTLRSSALGVPSDAAGQFLGDVGAGLVASAGTLGHERPVFDYAVRRRAGGPWLQHEWPKSDGFPGTLTAAGSTLVLSGGPDGGTVAPTRLLHVSHDYGATWHRVPVAMTPMVTTSVHLLADGRLLANGLGLADDPDSERLVFSASPDEGRFTPLRGAPRGVRDVAVARNTVVLTIRTGLAVSRDGARSWSPIAWPETPLPARRVAIALLGAQPPGAAADDLGALTVNLRTDCLRA